MMNQSDMTAKIRAGKGFIAALDQSGGSTPKALTGYGIAEGSWSNDDEMYALIHEMRSRIIRSPAFTSDKVIGAILFERTMDGQVDGKPTTQALIDKGIVPFLKVDQGLEAEENGVQMMKPVPGLDALLDRAHALGVFGTKERSVINSANETGIAVLVAQQFQMAAQVIAKGMMPILEPEVNIKSVDRDTCDRLLLAALSEELDHLPEGQQVMLKLSIPATAGLYEPLVDHPKVLKVVALSGGYGRTEACAELKKNRGIIASFSRALLCDLRADMSNADFDAALGSAITAIRDASVNKV